MLLYIVLLRFLLLALLGTANITFYYWGCCTIGTFSEAFVSNPGNSRADRGGGFREVLWHRHSGEWQKVGKVLGSLACNYCSSADPNVQQKEAEKLKKELESERASKHP